MTNTYQLTPFATDPISYTIAAKVERQQHILVFTFVLTDPLNEVIWSQTPFSSTPTRQDFLWENTCFEAFIGTPTQTGYLELNLSPAHAWNLYRFSAYRMPSSMPPPAVAEPALLRFEIKARTVQAEIDLHILGLANQELQLGLTTVVKTAQGIAYFALSHPKADADFHDAHGWILRLLPDARFPEAIS
jgi:hypothetical protein